MQAKLKAKRTPAAKKAVEKKGRTGKMDGQLLVVRTVIAVIALARQAKAGGILSAAFVSLT